MQLVDILILFFQPAYCRSDQIVSLQSGEEYDVLVIGGGATGTGVALDAVTRGTHDCLQSYAYTCYVISGLH